jgi:hypothetical protein
VRPRPLRLRPWLVRALIPPRLIGTYVLYTAHGRPIYVGRSDTDVRRRLLRHCTDRHGDYFTYDMHHTTVNAYDVECALFHLLAAEVSNRIHPDRPDFHPTTCAFCRPLQTRLRLRASNDQSTQPLMPAKDSR